MKRRRALSLVALAGGVGILFLAVPAIFSQAQQPAAPGIRVQLQLRRGVGGNLARSGNDALDPVFLPPDRQAKRRLELATELIGERRYGEAVRLLGSLLEGTEDFFFKPDADEPVFRSLKAEAGRLLADLPNEGRESYELQYGARARQMLEAAAAKGDLSQVAEVSRQFFFTQAGAEATFLLGRHYLDQNRPLAAALCFERLLELPAAAKRLDPALSLSLASCWLRSGKPREAERTLAEFRRRHASGEVVLGGKRVELFTDDAQALAWMEKHFGEQPPISPVEADQWTMFRGDESRNAPSAGGRPLLSLRWRQRTSDDSTVEEFVRNLRRDYLSQDVVALPSMHPLAVADVVLMRTAFALQAVDFKTGKLVWKYPAGEQSLEQFLRAMGSQGSGQGAQRLMTGLDQRIWEDTTYGTLASDGQRVYYVEDLDLSGLSSNVVMTVRPNGRRQYSMNTRGTNRLAARDLRTEGKLKWAVGGVTGEDEPKLAGAFFLGPPLPLLGNLYALAEMKGQEVRLVVISPETGALEWSQQLAVVDPPVTMDPFRRNSGATPSFADGVLVCPTTAGAVVGIDLSTRSLLWGYQYPRVPQQMAERLNVRAAIYAGAQQRSNDHWADASITVASGRVLVTPIETDDLYCLDLLDGQEQWKQSRGANLYVACVDDGNVILVGHSTVSAVKLSDGSKAWPDLELPSGSMPSGRGFYSPEHYYLPLTSAQVAKINLRTGKIEALARSRSGDIPGNLICYRDSIVSQGSEYLDAYFQLDALKAQVAETLAANADDPKALAALAEVRLDEGALAESIDLFRRSYDLAPEETTRVQLVESLLEGLRVDFAAYRDHVAELERFVDDPHHRLEFLRLKAMGLQASGEVMPAFEAYLKLVDQQAPWELDEVAEHLSVRRDRWIREQLARLRLAAGPEAEQHIDAVVTKRLEEALAAPTPEALRTFIGVFGLQPAAARAREALVAKLSPDDLLETNLLLERRILSTSDAAAAPATARLALALRASEQPDLAAVYYRQLAGRFADVPCGDGKTGSELVAELAPDDPVRKRLAADGQWPAGNVKIDEKAEKTARAVRSSRSPQLAGVEILGRRGSLFDDVSLSVAYGGQQHLIGQDGWGRDRFRVLLTDQSRRSVVSRRNGYNVSINYARVYGGLLVMSLGTELVAIDTLRGGDASASRILWSEDLNDQIGGLSPMHALVPRPVNQRWGQARYVPEDTFGRRYGQFGPINEDGVFFQRLHELYCVDPLTGKTIWTRRNVPAGLDLFGDEEYLFAAPHGDEDRTAGGNGQGPEDRRATETLVLSAATGELLGTRRLGKLDERMATLGRNVLTWQTADRQHVLQMRDAWLDKPLWSHSFAIGSKAAVVAEEVVGVLEPDGQFSLVRLTDGKRLSHERLEAANTLMGIYLLPSDEAYVLVVHNAERRRQNVSVQPFPPGSDCQLVSGHVYAFDRQNGKKLWPKGVPVSQQGLLLTQPANLPVLVLLRQVHRVGPTSARDSKLSVMCIDKRTGRVVYAKDDLPGTTVAGCELDADPAAHTVTISLPNRSITLNYSDDPADPQAALRGPPAAVEAGLAGAGVTGVIPR